MGTISADYQFETQLLTDGVITENMLKGNLYLKASGDPSLTSDNLEQLIKKLHTEKITEISGDLCIDQEDFDRDCFAPGSLLDNIGYAWNSPVAAFMVDRKPVSLGETNAVIFMDNNKLSKMFFDGSEYCKNILAKNNITLSGNIVFNKCPVNSILLTQHKSELLTLLISKMLKESDNLYADCLFKKIGTMQYGYPGTWQKGIDAANDFLRSKYNLDRNEYILQDGSGRSRYNLVAPHHVVTLLTWIYNRPYFSLFANSLSIAGIDGTLKDRMINNATYKSKNWYAQGGFKLVGVCRI